MKTTIKSILAAALCAVGFAAFAEPEKSVTQIELEKIFDVANTATMVKPEYDADGNLTGHTVILGQNHGPVAFSNDFGSVTIDLNGWKIVGTDGADGTATTAGGNGVAAITVAGTCGAAMGDTSIMVKNDICVQLWENGPHFAQCNIGATKPEDYGYYFWWGDTVGYVRDAFDIGWDASDGSVTGFSFTEGNCQTSGKSIEELYDDGNGYIDANNEDGKLKPEYDAATCHWGAPWRMPTKAELDALVENCTTEWTDDWEGTGKAGRIVKGKGDYESKSIFLPAAGYGTWSYFYDSGSYGYYRSSAPDSIYGYYAWTLSFDSGDFSVGDFRDRYFGQPVRAVRGSEEVRPVSGPAAALIGGNGGNGNPAGKGAFAVMDATGAEVPVSDPLGLVKNGEDGLVPGDPVEYLDWDGEKMVSATCTVYVVVTDGMNTFKAGRTYVVKNSVTASSTITVNGTEESPTRLILCDGAKLTVEGAENEAGLAVTTGHALVICGQAEGTGVLEATGGDKGAGIGGGFVSEPVWTGFACGNVTINGGVVTATGGEDGSGIGGGYGVAGGSVTINGGSVTATGIWAMGIGGTVEFGAGFVGGVLAGEDEASATTVLTQAEYKDDSSAEYVRMPVAAICVPQAVGVVYAVSNGTEEIVGKLANGAYYYIVEPGSSPKLYFALDPLCEEYEVPPGNNPMDFGIVNGVKEIDAADLPKAKLPSSITYRDWDDVGKKMIDATCTEYEIVTSGTDVFAPGKTYVVVGDVVRTMDIMVNGTVAEPTRLILCDGAKLVAKEGVCVTVTFDGATTNALIICGQAEGTGTLETSATYMTFAAGIGGNCNSEYGNGDGGIVTINGGTIVARGYNNGAAGIGGYRPGYDGRGSGGTVTINGGTVTAIGGGSADGIGRGRDNYGGEGKTAGTVKFGEGLVFSVVTGKTEQVAVPVAQEDYENDHSATYVHIEAPKSDIVYTQVAATEALEFTVDSRTGERVIDGSAAETFTYSAAGWDKGAAGSASIAYTLNGGAPETFAEGLTGNGDTNWLPKVNGKFAFTHTPGDKEGDMTATFVVAGLTYTLTIAQTNALDCVVSNETGVITGENGVYTINAGDKIWVVFTPTEDYRFTGDAPAPTVYDVFDGDKEIGESELPETEPYGDLVFKLVRAAQRYPWNGKVDIVFAVTNLRPKVEYALATAFTVKDTDLTKAQTNDLPAVWRADGIHTNTVNVADESWFGAESLTNAPSKLSVKLLRE